MKTKLRTRKRARKRIRARAQVARKPITQFWIHCGERVRSVTVWRGDQQFGYYHVTPSSIIRVSRAILKLAVQSAKSDQLEFQTFSEKWGIRNDNARAQKDWDRWDTLLTPGKA
jgi:hypothetical protein